MATPEEQRAYQNAWVKSRRMEWIRENGPCGDCGSWEWLEVDHQDASTKLLNPAKLWGMSRTNPKRVAELAKCVVRCHRCHDVKTVARKENARGEQIGNTAHVPDTLVQEVIRRYSEGGCSYKGLAREYGTTDKTVRNWVLGITRNT